MTFEEFQALARLYVLGTLDEDEMASFQEARTIFGAEAEGYLRDCRHLASALAFSLQPQTTQSNARERLLTTIREDQRPLRRRFH